MKVRKLVEDNLFQVIYDTVLIVLTIFAVIFLPSAKTFDGILNAFSSKSYLIVALIGMVFVQASGSVDFSCATQSMMISALACRLIRQDVAICAVIILCVSVGAISGVLRGYMIGRMGLTPTAACLGALAIYYGVYISLLPDNAAIGTIQLEGIFANKNAIAIDPALIIACLMLICVEVFFNRTYLGKEILATKLAIKVAQKSGIDTKRVIVFTCGICGALIALSTVIFDSGSSVMGTDQGIKLLIETIALTHISCASMSPAVYGLQKLRAWRVLITVYLFATLEEMCALLNIGSGIIYIVYGLLTMLSIMNGKGARDRRKMYGVYIKI